MKCVSCGASLKESICIYCGSSNDSFKPLQNSNTSLPQNKSSFYKDYFSKIPQKVTNNHNRFFFTERIPENLKISAEKSYGKNIDSDLEEILFLYDSSTFKNGKYGLFITNKFIYFSFDDSLKGRIEINEIKNVQVKKGLLNGEIYFNKQFLCKFPTIGTSLLDDFNTIFSGIFKIIK